MCGLASRYEGNYLELWADVTAVHAAVACKHRQQRQCLTIFYKRFPFSTDVRNAADNQTRLIPL